MTTFAGKRLATLTMRQGELLHQVFITELEGGAVDVNFGTGGNLGRYVDLRSAMIGLDEDLDKLAVAGWAVEKVVALPCVRFRREALERLAAQSRVALRRGGRQMAAAVRSWESARQGIFAY